MKRPLAILAGFAVVSACSLAAILTAQERYEDASKVRRSSGVSSMSTTATAFPAQAVVHGQAMVNEYAVAVQNAQQFLKSAGTDKEREEAQDGLREALSAQFDADVKKREEELESIRKRLTEMTELLEKRTAAKEEIVDLRLQVLSQDADGLGWADSNDGWLIKHDAGLSFFQPASIGATFPAGAADFARPSPAAQTLPSR